MSTTADFTQLLAASRGRGHGGSIPTMLGTTGLVHQCYLRPAGAPRERIADRGHIFKLVSRIMRQILCGYAHRSLRVKRVADRTIASRS